MSTNCAVTKADNQLSFDKAVKVLIISYAVSILLSVIALVACASSFTISDTTIFHCMWGVFFFPILVGSSTAATYWAYKTWHCPLK